MGMQAFLHRPTTRCGRRSVELMLAGLGTVLVATGLGQLFEGAAAPGIAGAVGLVIVVAGGCTAVTALVRRHERSWIVYAAALPALVVLWLVIGEFALPAAG
jgi:hypothetical protein